MKLWLSVFFVAFFLGFFLGRSLVFGEDKDVRKVALEVELPTARVLPGHPFYPLKEFGRSAREFLSFGSVFRARSHLRSLRERLGEVYGLSLEKPSSEIFLNATDAYRDELGAIVKAIGKKEGAAGAFLSDFFEESFYEVSALLRLKKEFPEFADSFSLLREEVFLALREVMLLAPSNVSLRVSSLYENILPAIGFFDDVARMVEAPHLKARILFYENELVTEFRGRYLAGEYRLGGVLSFFSSGDISFSLLRTLDILLEAFSHEELGNQLQFLRQDLFSEKRTFSFSPSLTEQEISFLEESLAMFRGVSDDIPFGSEAKFRDADFTYDRALEFFSSGFFDRALLQASLSFSSLHSFILETSFSLEHARGQAYALRDELETMKEHFRNKANSFPPQASLFLREAEESMAELLVQIGKDAIPNFSLFFRVQSFLIALARIQT